MGRQLHQAVQRLESIRAPTRSWGGDPALGLDWTAVRVDLWAFDKSLIVGSPTNASVGASLDNLLIGILYNDRRVKDIGQCVGAAPADPSMTAIT
jgi:hypothetical protein